MTELATEIAPPRRRIWRTVLKVILAIPTTIILVTLVTLVAVNVIRDRNLWLCLFMYIPLWPVAFAAVAWDLILFGRALPLRFLLLCIGIATGILSIGMLWSPARAPEGSESQPTIKLLQWNTQWGGRRAQGTLDEIVDEIRARGPDIICLSEAPYPTWLKFTWDQRVPSGGAWYSAVVQNAPANDYWYRMTMMSRFPVRLLEQTAFQHGQGALFEVDVQAGGKSAKPLRVLMIDLKSYWQLERTPTLLEVAKLMNSYAERGQPVDIVAGDFNAPARFIGFDAIATAGEGYERAAFWSGQWRATWPTFLDRRGTHLDHTWRVSVLDIDHIFVRRSLDIAAAEIFQNDGTDHRGQTVTIRLRD